MHWQHPGSFAVDPFPGWPHDLAELIKFVCPYDLIYQAANWEYWACNVNFGRCKGTLDRDVLTGWHTVELFMIPPTFRDRLSPECLE